MHGNWIVFSLNSNGSRNYNNNIQSVRICCWVKCLSSKLTGIVWMQHKNGAGSFYELLRLTINGLVLNELFIRTQTELNWTVSIMSPMRFFTIIFHYYSFFSPSQISCSFCTVLYSTAHINNMTQLNIISVSPSSLCRQNVSKAMS